jgi:nitroreductase
MEIFEAIEKRHSVRKFKPDVPPIDDINKIINSARLAPSSNNAQMWHFIVIYNADIRAKMKRVIADTYDEIITWDEAKGHEESLRSYKEFSTFFTDAPVNIAVLMEPKGSIMQDVLRSKGMTEIEIQRCRPRPELLSIGASIENILLSASALGYGTCWLTAPICAYKKLEEILEVKSPYQLVSVICLGKPLDNTVPAKNKKDLSEILTVIE